jgi:transposase
LEAAVITDEMYVEIELLRKYGMSKRNIAPEVGCAVNTIRSHLEAAGFVEFVIDIKVQALACHHAFGYLGGVTRRVLYDDMKTVVIERGSPGEGEHRFHAEFLDYARHRGFIIKLCRPCRTRTKGKVQRFNGYPWHSFYVPLVVALKQAGLILDAVTANIEVRRWLRGKTHWRLPRVIERRRPVSRHVLPPPPICC